MEIKKVPVKLQAAAMICLLMATSLAATPNSTLLDAYTRHGIEAYSNLTSMVGNINDKAVLSDHLIRLGRHVQMLHQNIGDLEKAILANQDRFVNGDWTKEFAELGTKLEAMGFRGKLHNPDAISRAKILASIKQHGLRGHLQITGRATELRGITLASPYARLNGEPMGLVIPAAFFFVRPICTFWHDVGEGWMALGAIALAFPATAPLGGALAIGGGVMFLMSSFDWAC